MKLHELVRSHSEDAEMSLLGAVLLRGDVLDQVELGPEAFWDPRFRDIWSAMRRLQARKVPVDVTTLAEELGDRCASVGGYSTMTDLVSRVPTADNAEHYAGIVAEHAMTRAIAETTLSALTNGGEGEELLGAVLRAVTSVRTRRPDGTRRMSELAPAVLKRLEQLYAKSQAGDAAAWGIPTGLKALDQRLGGGLQPGVVTIVAGRPSMGKSALARTFLDHVVGAGYGGGHAFTLEDSAEAYTLRAFADHGRVPLHAIRSLKLNMVDFASLNAAGEELWKRRTWLVDDSAGLSSAEIAMRVRRHKETNQTRVVVVDYVQLMREPNADPRKRGDEVARAALGLQQLAREEDVAVVVLSQLSRDCEKREDKRPILSDLRETGELEQVAHTVLFVYRPEVYLDADNPKHRTELDELRGVGLVIIGKLKEGATGGAARMRFDGPTATFRDFSAVDKDYHR